jgi:bifunctional non-homologous end joining protein LigD
VLNTLAFGSAIEVVKTAYTRAEKLKMYNDLKEAKAEGVVFKLKTSKYVAGRPNSGGEQLKSKFYKEASFIVKDFTKGKRSVGLELINENGERVHMGKCTIPPNKDVPPIGAVVEVRYLYAYKGGAIFQSTYKHQRNDVDVKECLMTQIIYKVGQEVEVET